jgi:DNA anti-recombination protein RmuC
LKENQNPGNWGEMILESILEKIRIRKRKGIFYGT